MPLPPRMPTAGGRCADGRGEQHVDVVEDPVRLHRHLLGAVQRPVADPRGHPGTHPAGLPGAALQSVVVVDLVGLGADAGEELRHEGSGRVGVARVDLPDLVPQVGQQPDGVLERLHVERVEAHPERDRLRGPPDAQPPRLPPRGLDERARLPRPEQVALGVAADDVVDDRAVEHGAGERPGGAERPPQVRMRRGGDPAPLRLEPEQPATGAGDPDRAAAVTPQPDRHHARGHRDRRTPTGAARGARGVPGVAGDAPRHRLGVGEGPELRHRRLPDDHRACRPEPADDLGVRGGRSGVGLAAEGGDATRDVDLLLDGDGYAVQRPGLLAGLVVTGGRFGPGLVAEDHRERIEPGVEDPDPVQRLVGRSAGARLPGRDGTGGLGNSWSTGLGHDRSVAIRAPWA